MWNWFPALNFQRITVEMNYSESPHLSMDGWPLRRTLAELVSTWLIKSKVSWSSKNHRVKCETQNIISEARLSILTFIQYICFGRQLSLQWKSALMWETYCITLSLTNCKLIMQIGWNVMNLSFWFHLKIQACRIFSQIMRCHHLCLGFWTLIQLDKLIYLWWVFP